ncbi:unnamed protein product [Adineta steineri]|uniref:G-protein coupled receptors family 1 profile domain-containing protein n=1 Tax=Adineta steineri TaxID=433720 RepID=A0A815SAJ1_9BILA|nr:unnamed protein product [Adineta steineri]CAF1488450.1 unnamed protein product [Adineta steineri]
MASIFWIIDFVIFGFFDASIQNIALLRVYFQYLEPMFNCLGLYGFVTISVNRCFAVVYPHKGFFKKLSWCFISAGISWMVAIILPIPIFVACYEAYIQGKLLRVNTWIGLYSFFIILILPAVIFTISNGIIYFTVRAFSRRVNTITENTSGNFSIECLSSRDIRLLKHIVFVFIIYMTGWSPAYIATAADATVDMPDWLLYLLILPAGVSFVILLVDLLWYNHEIRKYLKVKFFKWLHIQ